MLKDPEEKRQQSPDRIWRNNKVYYAVFYKNDQTKVKVIYEIELAVMVEEVGGQLDQSRNSIAHIGFSESWVKGNNKILYKA